jgi:hypothetical protein
MTGRRKSRRKVPRWLRSTGALLVIAGVAAGAGSVGSASAPQPPRACIEFQA